MENLSDNSWPARLALYFVLVGMVGAAFMGWLAYSGFQAHGVASMATITAVPVVPAAAPVVEDAAKAAGTAPAPK